MIGDGDLWRERWGEEVKKMGKKSEAGTIYSG